jgi:hypothetical protein
VRGRIGVIGVGLLVLAGCGQGRPELVLPAPSASYAPPPASAAGGVCELLDYEVIEQYTGTRFEVSAASTHEKTKTCVVRTGGANLPDLSLSVTAAKVDAAAFKELVPRGAKTVKGLGKAAYQASTGPNKDEGAVTEVGWLTDDGKVLCLRYTFPDGMDKAAVDELAPKLVELAGQIQANAEA